MIGGNIDAVIQVYTVTKTNNEIGENVKAWEDVQTLRGYLDYVSGDSKYVPNRAKMRESTHVFVCDYVKLDGRITEEHSRMVIAGKVYDIMLLDNPMELCKQWEVYLKYTGGQ